MLRSCEPNTSVPPSATAGEEKTTPPVATCMISRGAAVGARKRLRPVCMASTWNIGDGPAGTVSATPPSGGGERSGDGAASVMPPSDACGFAADGSTHAFFTQIREPLQSVSLPQPLGSVAAGGQPTNPSTSTDSAT